MRRAVEQHWPALLAGSVCMGLAASNVVAVNGVALALTGLLALAAVALLGDGPRVVAVGAVLTIAGLWWGGLRLEATGESVLMAEIGESAPAELVVTGPARTTAWAVRVPAEVRTFRGRRLRERALLLLPVGRSPPRGAILETVVRVSEPRTAEGGFDERAWLARQGIHVVLRAGTWRQIGKRGGVAGVGDRVRDRVERAVGRGTVGVRQALVLGVVLGEDEGLPERVRNDFRASGLYHLLSVAKEATAQVGCVAGCAGNKARESRADESGSDSAPWTWMPEGTARDGGAVADRARGSATMTALGVSEPDAYGGLLVQTSDSGRSEGRRRAPSGTSIPSGELMAARCDRVVVWPLPLDSCSPSADALPVRSR